MAKEIERLQSWFQSHCNGDWEHDFGISIESLDNPGWFLRIDLAGTNLDNVSFDRIEQGNPEQDPDWTALWIEDHQFRAAGGLSTLATLIDRFLTWAEACQQPGTE